MSIGDEIKTIRMKTLQTQEDFASSIGVAASTVNRWETGKARPNISTMKEIKRFCDDNSLPYSKLESSWIKKKY